MADIYALLKWQPSLIAESPDCRVRIGIIGVPSRMRTVRSLLLFLALFARGIEEVVIIAEDDNGNAVFSPGQREELERAGLTIRVTADMEHVLPDLDVVYINAIASYNFV